MLLGEIIITRSSSLLNRILEIEVWMDLRQIEGCFNLNIVNSVGLLLLRMKSCANFVPLAVFQEDRHNLLKYQDIKWVRLSKLFKRYLMKVRSKLIHPLINLLLLLKLSLYYLKQNKIYYKRVRLISHCRRQEQLARNNYNCITRILIEHNLK